MGKPSLSSAATVIVEFAGGLRLSVDGGCVVMLGNSSGPTLNLFQALPSHIYTSFVSFATANSPTYFPFVNELILVNDLLLPTGPWAPSVLTDAHCPLSASL